MKKERNMRICRVSDLLTQGYNKERIISAFVNINKEAWPPPFPQEILWTKEEVSQHLENCPQLQFCAMNEDDIIGTVSIIHIAEKKVLTSKSWEEISGNGTLSTHNSKGDCTFGIDLSILPSFQGKKISSNLLQTAFLLSVILENKKGAFLGSRIPGYHKKSHIQVENYVWGRKMDGKTMDPEIRLYQSEGFRVVRIIPEYINDPDSLNYGVLMFWKNPFYKFTKNLPLKWLKPIFEKIFMR